MAWISFPWCSEVEWTHVDRIQELTEARKLLKASAKNTSQLLLTARNISLDSSIPLDVCKHITRVFYVPNFCRDVEWIAHHPDFQSVCADLEAKVKFYATPKTLESCLFHALVEDAECIRDGGSSRYRKLLPEQAHPTSFTHVLACVYSWEESLFRWGIFPRAFFIEQRMSHSLISVNAESSTFKPASRAYFKMKAVADHYLLAWGWKLPSQLRAAAGIDIGAAPGGWSQVLSSLCDVVVAIDPGELLLGDTCPNVRHLRHAAQSAEARCALQRLENKVGYIVCDVNADCRECARILVDHIFPYIKIEAHAVLVLTLKLVKNPKPGCIARAVEATKSILGSSGHVSIISSEVVHLSANSRNERTLIAKMSPRCIDSS